MADAGPRWHSSLWGPEKKPALATHTQSYRKRLDCAVIWDMLPKALKIFTGFKNQLVVRGWRKTKSVV